MIHIYYTGGDGRNELSVYGHANYGPCGKDIVCAGVSAIAYSLLGFLELCEDEIEDMTGPIVDNGKVYVGCNSTATIDTAFRMAVIGLEQIADAYPDHVEIQIVPQGE